MLDLFSAAAGGWSLGLHRAGFETVAACEWIDWRRVLYAENNPGVKIYDDVRTLTADQVRADVGVFPELLVASYPCQDISSANTKGQGVEGERSGLVFEVVRLVREGRPRWVALENSANLRTRGADAVFSAMEELGYACWAFVVRAGDVGANHERPRAWMLCCDVEQLADAPKIGREPWARDRQGEHSRVDWRLAGHDADDGDDGHSAEDGRGPGLQGRRAGATDEPEQSSCGDDAHAARLGHEGGRSRRHGPDGDGASPDPEGAGSPADADQAGQAEIADDGCGAGRSADRQGVGQMGLRPTDRLTAFQHRADWSLDDLARHIRLDDGLPAWLAEQRIAVGGPRGTSAASLIVEAFGDAVIPQIPEAIGRAILRVEAAMAAVARQDERSAA